MTKHLVNLATARERGPARGTCRYRLTSRPANRNHESDSRLPADYSRCQRAACTFMARKPRRE